MKIAVLILAHHRLDQLELLTNHLKKDFEVYIHFDKRMEPAKDLSDRNVHILQKRYAPYWGSVNTIHAILELLKKAYEDNCEYFMLISEELPDNTLHLGAQCACKDAKCYEKKPCV